MFLYLPKTKKAIRAEAIASIEEVLATIADPASKKGEREVPGASVVLIGAPLVDEGDDDNGETLPYAETFTGEDMQVLIAYRDHNLIRSLVLPLPDKGTDAALITPLPIPASAEIPEPEAVEVAGDAA